MATITGTRNADDLYGTEDADVIDGLGGDDNMVGGLGDDTYVADSTFDYVSENAGEGFDTVYSSATFFLPPEVERLVLTGTEDIAGYGNDLGNELYGNAGANALYGFESGDALYGGAGNDFLDSDGGDDRLDGGAGSDNMVGGMGDDTYVFGAGYGQDVAYDQEGADRLELVGGLTLADVTFARSGDNLVVSVRGTSDQLTIMGWYTGTQIESVAFDNGTVLDAAAVEALAANEPPVANDDPVAMGEDSAPATGNVLANDTDANVGDALAVKDPGTYLGTYGTLQLDADGSYSYSLGSGAQALAAGTMVTDSFGYTARDGAGAEDSAQLSFSIAGANDAPVLAAALADQAVQAGAPFSFGLPGGAFADADAGDSLAYAATLADGTALPDWLAFDPATGMFSGTAPAGAGGAGRTAPLQVRVTATDPAGATASDEFAFAVSEPPPPPPGDDPAPLGRHIVGTRRGERLVGGSGDDLIEGRKGNDVLRGKGGTDFLRGEEGNDWLIDRRGGNVFDGGKGHDRMVGGRDDDFFAGGRGNDRVVLGGGHDVVAFNKGDGVDRLFGRGGQEAVLSLGGGIRYEDLKFSKQGNDLVLRTGGNDRVVFEGWYRGHQSVVTLQVVAEAMPGFSQGSKDTLRDDRVETFDFRQLVEAFDDARACERNLKNWKLMGELLDAHLGGSDSSAYGGDLAYRYGMTGSLAGVGWAAARDTVASSDFGNQMQALDGVRSEPVPT